MYTYFNPVPQTLEELKKMYHKLATIHHPDVGGSKEDMQKVNNEYESLFATLKTVHKNTKTGEFYSKETNEVYSDFITIIDVLIKLPNVVIEMCGKWLWITGNTKPYAKVFRSLGCQWASKKQAWFYHRPEDAARSNGNYTLSDIREIFGSKIISDNNNNKNTIKNPALNWYNNAPVNTTGALFFYYIDLIIYKYYLN